MVLAELPDPEFLSLVESGEVPNDAFRHLDHLRFAWLVVREGQAQASDRVAAALRRLAIRHGVESKYHETLSRGWTSLVRAAIGSDPAETFPGFLGRNAQLLDRKLLRRFYSAELLRSDAARSSWVRPDLGPLP